MNNAASFADMLERLAFRLDDQPDHQDALRRLSDAICAALEADQGLRQGTAPNDVRNGPLLHR